MSRRKKDVNASRIQRAVTGMLIPTSAIPALYAHAEKLIADGADDVALAAGVRKFMGASRG